MVTKAGPQLVISFTDIVSIEKKMTAFVIPNAIQVTTLHAKVGFISLRKEELHKGLMGNG